MKILYLTKYTSLAASSRMRSYQYFPYLEKAGFEITVHPFFDDHYLRDFYAGKRNMGAVLKSYIRRFFILFSLSKYDQIVIEKELFPYAPALAEKIMALFGVKYIVDYDDAIFHNYDQSTQPILRKFLGNKIDKVMKHSTCVVAGNSYLADRAKKAGAKRVEIIPTVVDLNRYSLSKKKENDEFVIGWIGTKTTFEKHLAPCKSWIQKLGKTNPEIKFHIVGIPEDRKWGENMQWIPWSEEGENSEIGKMDVGIMPLQNSLWEKGKCAYKLIQYAACGIPGIASDVGMNSEITIPGKTGYLASTEQEWMDHILFLKNNPSQRQELGKNARELVEEKYCLQVTAEKWLNLLNPGRV